MTPVTCPYCGREPVWVENSAVYGRKCGRSYMIYLCRHCDAYVGCHHNTRRPLGTLADRETRWWRLEAHKAFDPIWQSGLVTRNRAYRLASEALGREIHIGESDVTGCKEIIEFAVRFQADRIEAGKIIGTVDGALKSG